MSKFMILYRAEASALEQMANATPEQQEAGMEAWRAWANKVGYAIADLGSPLGHTTHVGPGAAGSTDVAGYSILEAGSADEVESILFGHPHLSMPRDHPDRRSLTRAPSGDLYLAAQGRLGSIHG
jgi:hypothetical protein